MTHVRTSPYYPQSTERLNAGTNRSKRVHPAGNALSLEVARRLAEGYVEHYNNVRLNSAIGYMTARKYYR